MIGKTVSHYRIIEQLGRGGMGVVYKVQGTTLERIVALKFIPSNIALQQEMKDRLIREAKALASLNHPNITSNISLILFCSDLTSSNNDCV